MTWSPAHGAGWHPQWLVNAFPGHPLFDAGPRLHQQLRRPGCYPTLQQHLRRCPLDARNDWRQTAQFLAAYVDQPNTYLRFRGELQRFLNFLWSDLETTLGNTTAADIQRYLDFCIRPPSSWQSSTRAAAFTGPETDRRANPRWRPFLAQERPPSPATQSAATRVLTLFFSDLAQAGYLRMSPLQVRRSADSASARDTPSADRWQPPPVLPALTPMEWQFTVNHLVSQAAMDARRERELFLVVIMKGLFLRVSDVGYTPSNARGGERFLTMGDFRQRSTPDQRTWVLRVPGPRGQAHWVPVEPAVWPFLERFRRWLGLSPIPSTEEATALVPGRTLTQALCKRQVERLVWQTLRGSAEAMEHSGYSESAAHLRAIATRTDCLRHTGALMALARGCPVQQLSNWLGHATVDQTAQLYRPTGFKDLLPNRH